MPALMAVIGANSEPMQRELRAVQRLARETGVSVKGSLSGGGLASSGSIYESVVLLRELGRGNYSRMIGSVTILAQRLGLLKLISGGGANAAQLLAQAWEVQAQKAGLAAIAATRKAAASQAAFYADAEETEATLAQAVADEEGAAAAILNAKATQAKAVAAGEAAGATGAAAGVSLGAIGVGLSAVLVVALALYETFWGFAKAVKGFTLPDLKLDYIPKMLRASADALNAQRLITDEVRKTTDAYNSAAAAAKRASDITKEHFEHLRKMNSFERDPRKRAAGELAIDSQERAEGLAGKIAEKVNLEIESKRKLSQANAIGVPSEADDAETKKQLEQNRQAAKLFLGSGNGAPGFWDNVKAAAAVTFGGNPLKLGDRMAQIQAAQSMSPLSAHKAIDVANNFDDAEQQHKIARELKKQLEGGAAKAAADAAALGLQIPDIQKANNQKDSDAAQESAAALRGSQRFKHGSVNDLQAIGAYAAPAVLVDLNRKMEGHLKSIDNKIDKIGGGTGTSRSLSSVHYGS
jgi:hypothetical protein